MLVRISHRPAEFPIILFLLLAFLAWRVGGVERSAHCNVLISSLRCFETAEKIGHVCFLFCFIIGAALFSSHEGSHAVIFFFVFV
jgi:hypothetical protein